MMYAEVTSLYKYRAFNQNALQNIIDGTAWFSTPSAFNDPFDCRIIIDKRRHEEVIVKEMKKQNYELHETKDPKKTLGENYLPAIEILDEYDTEAQLIMQRLGIFSLSQTNDHLLMWAHYSDCHKGFCIEYDRSPDNFLGKEAHPVIYLDEITPYTLDDSANRERIGLLWRYKSKHWEYEEEWRVGQMEGGKSYDFPCKIKSIIFGLQMNEDNRKKIRNILKGQDIVFKEAKMHPTQFALCIHDL